MSADGRMSAVPATSAPAAARPNGKPEKEWLSRKEAALYLTQKGCKVTAKTLQNKASNNNAGGGPPFTRHAWSSVQYRRADLDVWAAARATRVE